MTEPMCTIIGLGLMFGLQGGYSRFATVSLMYL